MQLQVDWLKLGGAPLLHTAGRLGISGCPGRPELGGGVGADVETLRTLGVSTVLSLAAEAERRSYGASGLGEALVRAGLRHLEHPIVDGLPPADLGEARALCLRVLALLGEGERVLLHCIGGWGRSGTVAAALLCHEGHSPRRAIELVRQARSPRCIETVAQEVFVHKYAQLQRGYRRRYLFLPRAALGRHLSGVPGERRVVDALGLLTAESGEQLTRAIIQTHRTRGAAGDVLVLSGEVEAGAGKRGELGIDRAYQISGTGLLPVALREL